MEVVWILYVLYVFLIVLIKVDFIVYSPYSPLGIVVSLVSLVVTNEVSEVFCAPFNCSMHLLFFGSFIQIWVLLFSGETGCSLHIESVNSSPSLAYTKAHDFFFKTQFGDISSVLFTHIYFVGSST